MANMISVRLILTWLGLMAAGVGLSYIEWGTTDVFNNFAGNLTQLFKHWHNEAVAGGQEMVFWGCYAASCLIIAKIVDVIMCPRCKKKPGDPGAS